MPNWRPESLDKFDRFVDQCVHTCTSSAIHDVIDGGLRGPALLEFDEFFREYKDADLRLHGTDEKKLVESAMLVLLEKLRDPDELRDQDDEAGVVAHLDAIVDWAPNNLAGNATDTVFRVLTELAVLTRGSEEREVRSPRASLKRKSVDLID
jgi:hypothetical protein